MGVYIKGMEMPTTCAACRIGYIDIGWDNEDNEHEIVFCPIIQQGSLIADAGVERHPLCPLVPVPPHGDLIDRDALEQDAQKRLLICDKNDNQFQRPYEVIRAIALSPAIIPASEEGES